MTEEILVLEHKSKSQQQLLQKARTPKAKIELLQREEEVKEAKVVIGIPASPSKSPLESTVRHFWKLADGIFVCDDGTTDMSSMKEEYMGCNVISQPPNLDYFSSIRSLMIAALNVNAEVLVVVDPGTKFSRSGIEDLAKPIVFENCDIVIGESENEGGAENDTRSEYVISSVTKNQASQAHQQQQKLPPKAYSKNAMLQLVEYDNGSKTRQDLDAQRQSPAAGLRIRKCPISVYGIEENEQVKGKRLVTIKVRKRPSKVVRKAASSSKILLGPLIKIPRLFKRICFSRRSSAFQTTKQEQEKTAQESIQPQLAASQPFRESRATKLGRSIRLFFGKIKKGIIGSRKKDQKAAAQ
jgi:hypothetical protein